jgi:hypothetical protein
VIFGTSVNSYIYEALAIVVIAFGAIIAIFWEDLFKAKKVEPKTEEK